jgi:hypothetical protein
MTDLGQGERRYSWTQPCCEICWVDRYPGREPTRLKYEVREDENCVYCAAHTFSGIYVRVDPAEAPYPTLEKN